MYIIISHRKLNIYRNIFCNAKAVSKSKNNMIYNEISRNNAHIHDKQNNVFSAPEIITCITEKRTTVL